MDAVWASWQLVSERRLVEACGVNGENKKGWSKRLEQKARAKGVRLEEIFLSKSQTGGVRSDAFE